MKKRTKIIILAAMVVLLGVTGYLNIMLNRTVINEQTITTSSNYFSSFRTYRDNTRDRELLAYDSIIDNDNNSPETRKQAEQDKLNLIQRMENELNIEGLIRAKGFEDAVITITDENINVIVKADTLTRQDVNKIVSVVQTVLHKDDIIGINVSSLN